MTASNIKDRNSYNKMLSKNYEQLNQVSQGTAVRNPSWLTMPTLNTTDDKIVVLHAVFENANYVAFSVDTSGSPSTSSWIVDWGDGVVEYFNSTVTAQHEYNFATFDTSNTTLVTDNGTLYKQALITITPNTGRVISAASFNKVHTALTGLAGSTFNSTSSGLLDISVNCPSISTNLTFSSISSVITHANLEFVTIGNLGTNFNHAIGLFANLIGLKKATIHPINTYCNQIAFCFYNCRVLVEAPMFYAPISSIQQAFQEALLLKQLPTYSIASTVIIEGAFNWCASLQSVDFLNGAIVASGTATSVFNGCTSLVSLPMMDMSAVTSINSFAYQAYSLTSIPAYNFQSCTTATQAFRATKVREIPTFNFNSLTNATQMFMDCPNLETVRLSLPALTNATQMFANTSNLRTANLYTPNLLNLDRMFNIATALQSIDLNTPLATNFSQTFSGCTELKNVKLTTANATHMSLLFYNCTNLFEYPVWIDYSKVTEMNSMFYGTSISIFPDINAPLCTSAYAIFGNSRATTVGYITLSNSTTTLQNMFRTCIYLKSFKGFTNTSFPLCNNISYMFENCILLQAIDVPQLTNATANMTSAFQYCWTVNSIKLGGITTSDSQSNVTNIFGSCQSLSSLKVVIGKLPALSLTKTKLNKTALEDFMLNYLSRPSTYTSPTLTLTGTLGSPTPISKSVSAAASGNITFNCADTTNIVLGMQVTGTGSPLTTAQSCTFQDATDTVTIANHGYSDGDRVSFPTIVTTTGISVYTYYYVINSTTNTFQLASSVGGSVLSLTTNGTGTIKITTVVTAIVPNTSITVSRKLTATATTLSFQLLKTEYAILKAWNITQ
jgi:hypothetical protein